MIYDIGGNVVDDAFDANIIRLQQLNRPTRTGSRTLGTPPLCLLHFSDIHGDKKRLSNIVRFKNMYSNYIADAIHTGDIVTSSSSDGIAFWTDTPGAQRILNVIGNHDTRANSSWVGKSMEDCYNTYFSPFISNWGVVSTAGKTYYYKDYATNKVRLIVLDYMRQTSEQLSWFASTLESARTSNLHVIVAAHGRSHWSFDSYTTPWDDKIINPDYKAGYTDQSVANASHSPSNLSNDYADAVDDFINAGGSFICWIHGHVHHKMFAKLHTHQNQLDIGVCNAGCPDYAWTFVWDRVPGTESEDDFNVLAVDTYSKVLKIAKFGVNFDLFMRYVDTISYNYETGELIYTN